VVDPPLSVSCDARVIREVAVPDPVDPQLRAIVHHLDGARLSNRSVMFEPEDLWVRLTLGLTWQNDVVADTDVDNVLWSDHKLWSRMHRQMVPRSIRWLNMMVRFSVEQDHLAVVPPSVTFLNVCQIERGNPKTFLVSRVDLGYPTVVCLPIHEGLGAVGRVIVIPDENWGIAPSLFPLYHIRDCLIIWKVGMAVEMYGLA